MGNSIPQSSSGVSPERRKSINAAGTQVIRKRLSSLHGDVNEFDPPKYPKTDENILFLKKTLSDNFLYECLDKDEREHFIHALEEETIEREIDVIKKGDTGDYFYVIGEGNIKCCADRVTTTLSKGACFGELSLLYSSPRAATCRTITRVTLWKISHIVFRNMIAYGEKKKSNAIIDVLKKVHFLSLLDNAQLNKLVHALIPISCCSGTQIVKKGEIGKHFYIIKEGSVKIHDMGSGNSKFTNRIISTGDHFGELALQSGEYRKANVTAMTDCSLLYLSRADFQKNIGDYNNLLKRAFRRQVLLSATVFATAELKLHEVNLLSRLFKEKTFEKDERLATIGDVVSNPGFCIIEEGMVRIAEDKGTITELIKGDHFGGNTIKLADKYISERNIKFLEPTKLAVLSSRSIESVIFSTERLGKPQKLGQKLADITFEDLNQFGILEDRDIGTVRLVTHKTTSTPYALKIMSKRTIINEKKIKNIFVEKNIIAAMVHFPFVINIVATFQDLLNVYILFDIPGGGKMFDIVHSRDKIIKGKSEAVFYSSCILLCLIHFSSHSICYRNLRPENILIDQDGYCVLINFGEAKIVPNKTYTICGAPEYMAPEILLGKGYNYEADYWSFGVFIYDLLAAKTPFSMRNIEVDNETLFKNILKARYSFPENGAFTEDTKDLIRQLLVNKPYKRLGCLADGAGGIKKHTFFDDVDWRGLYAKELRAPWLPNGKIDLSGVNNENLAVKTKEQVNGYLFDYEQDFFKEF